MCTVLSTSHAWTPNETLVVSHPWAHPPPSSTSSIFPSLGRFFHMPSVKVMGDPAPNHATVAVAFSPMNDPTCHRKTTLPLHSLLSLRDARCILEICWEWTFARVLCVFSPNWTTPKTSIMCFVLDVISPCERRGPCEPVKESGGLTFRQSQMEVHPNVL